MKNYKMAVCIALIGKDNAPKFISCNELNNELEFHFKVHSALDIIEEKLSVVSKSTNDIRDSYLGMLYATEEHKLYGYVTNTKIKIIIVVDANQNILRDNDIRAMFRKLHSAYADVVCNPFYIPGEVITSKKFQEIVRGMFTKG